MKLGKAEIALLTLAVLAVVGLAGVIFMAVKGQDIPEWLKLSLGPLITYLMGVATPTPNQKKGA